MHPVVNIRAVRAAAAALAAGALAMSFGAAPAAAKSLDTGLSKSRAVSPAVDDHRIIGEGAGRKVG